MTRYKLKTFWVTIRTAICLAALAAAAAAGTGTDDAMDLLLAEGSDARVENAIMMLSASSIEARREALQALPALDAFGDVATAYADWLDIHGAKLDHALRADAALAAAHLKCTRSAQRLALWLDPDGDPHTREVILYALGELGDPGATAAIRPLTTHAEEWTRFLAREALATIGKTWRASDPVWPGPAARGLMVACRTGEPDGEHLYWKAIADRDFGGRLMFVALTMLKPGKMGGWHPGRPGANGRPSSAPAVHQFDFDDEGRPEYAVCVFIEMNIVEVDTFFLWRLFNYVRRGGHAAIVGTAVFHSAIQRELIGTTVLGGGIYGKIVRRFQWPRGPWDAIIPQAQERMPSFPNIDGLTPPAKEFYFGYTPIEKGGLLLMVQQPARHLDLTGIEGGVPKDTKTGLGRGDAFPDYGPVWPAIVQQLVSGPDACSATIDWSNEAHPIPSPRAGQALDLEFTVRSRVIEGPCEILARITCPERGLEIASASLPINVVRGRNPAPALRLEITPLAAPGDYSLELSLRHKGAVQHQITRRLDIEGRYDLAIEVVPPVPDATLQSTLRFSITDHGGEALRDGVLSVELRDDDRARVMARWSSPWNGPTATVSRVEMPLTLPPGLPPGQYTLAASAGDSHGRTFGNANAEMPVARFFDFKRDFLWSVWGRSAQAGRNPVMHSIGINTAFGWGNFVQPPGFPYQYAVISYPFVATGQWPGDIYLGHGAAAGQRASWERLAQTNLVNARAVAINMIEEVGYDSHAPGLPAQRDLYLQAHYRTIARLNREAAVDVQAWDQLVLARATPDNKLLAHGYFHYDFRDTLLNMRAYWYRAHNTNVNLQPGMGAGLRSPWYDSMHMRTYLRRATMTEPVQYRTTALPNYGRTPFTWLLNMYHNTNVADQARVAWAAIAAGGRHLCNYAPGDRYGAELQETDGTLSASGKTFARVIASVKPCEPVLCDAGNMISNEVLLYDNHPWGYAGWDGVIDTLLRLGIQPRMSDRASSCRIMFFSNGNFNNAEQEIAELHKAVEGGLVLVIGPGGNPALARSFGIRIPDPAAAHIPPGGLEWAEDPEETPDFMGAAEPGTVENRGRLRFGAMSAVLDGIGDLSLEAAPGPAAGVAADSPLTYAGSAAFGAIGKGLVVYINARAIPDRARSAPVDFQGWARLFGALLARAGVNQPFRILDANGALDPWFAGYLLDTSDHSQQYLLVQLNSTVPEDELRDGTRTARVEVRDPSFLRVNDIGLAQTSAIRDEGGKRFFDLTLVPGHGTVVSLIREAPGGLVAHASASEATAGHRLPVAVLYRGTDGNPAPAAHTVVITALGDDGEPVPGFECRCLLEHGYAVLNPWIALSDPRGAVTLRVQDVTTGESVDLPIHISGPGQAAAKPVWHLDGPLLHGVTTAGSIRFHTPDTRVVPPADFIIEVDVPWVSAEVGKANDDGTIPFSVTVAADAPAGDVMLRGISRSAPRSEGTFIIQIPPRFTMEVDPLPDFRAPDIVVAELAGRIRNHTAQPRDARITTELPPGTAFSGEAAARRAVAAGSADEFRIPLLLSRQAGRTARREDLTLAVRAVDGNAILAEAFPRFLVNPWDTAPAVVSSLDGGTASLSISNATRSAVDMRIRIKSTDGFAVSPEHLSLSVPAGGEAVAQFAVRNPEPPPGDGIYELPYTAEISDGNPVAGCLLIERRTMSRWWIGTRSLIRGTDALDAGGAGSVSPWSFDRSVFRAAKPPAGKLLNTFSTALDLEAATPKPEPNSLVIAATRIVANSARKVVAELVRADGTGVRTIRSSDPDQARPGANGEPLRAMLRINGILLIDSRASDSDMDDPFILERPQPSLTLSPGVNTLLLLYEAGLTQPSGTDKVAQLTTRLPRLFVRLRDAATGQLINDLSFDVKNNANNEMW